MSNPIYNQISERIIKEQALIIGPLAWDEAGKVNGIIIQKGGLVSVSGEPKDVLNRLVFQYSRLFGRASTEACKEAVQDLLVELPVNEIPDNLK